MKKAFIVFFSIFILAAFNISSPGAEPLKIGVFDIQKVMRGSKTVEGYRQKLEKEIGVKKKTFAEKQEAIRQGEEKFRKEGQKGSPAERKFHEDKLENDIKELKRLKEDLDLDLQKMDRELTQKAFREIGEVIGKIAESGGYTIVFEKSSAGIAYFQDSVDITDKVISDYDRK